MVLSTQIAEVVRDRVFESIAIVHSGQNPNFFIKKIRYSINCP
jgi:hypothetical protein